MKIESYLVCWEKGGVFAAACRQLEEKFDSNSEDGDIYKKWAFK